MDFDAFIQTAKKSLDAHSDIIMDEFFDTRTETNLVREIRDILDELKIIQTITKQQESVLESFIAEVARQNPKSKHLRQRPFSMVFGNHLEELRRTAERTYAAVSCQFLSRRHGRAVNHSIRAPTCPN